MEQLAIYGGQPIRKKCWPLWPVFDAAEESNLKCVLESSLWCSDGGIWTKAAEEKISEYLNNRNVVLLSSGTAALVVALTAHGIGRGDEVIIPAYTFVATVNSVVEVGATPVIVDVDENTCCIDIDKVKLAVTEKTKAIIPVHIAGNVCNMDELNEIALKNDLIILEDAAQAYGSSWNGTKVGSSSAIACFSLQKSKCLTCGDGGFIVANDKNVTDICRSFINFGRSTNNKGYFHKRYGLNFRPSEFNAAVLCSQIDRFSGQMAARKRNVQYLLSKLAGTEGVIIQKKTTEETKPNYYSFMFRFEEEFYKYADKQFIADALSQEGLDLWQTYFPINKNFFMASKNFINRTNIDCYNMNFIGAEKIHSRYFCIPHYCFLGDERDMDDICNAIEKVLKYISNIKHRW